MMTMNRKRNSRSGAGSISDPYTPAVGGAVLYEGALASRHTSGANEGLVSPATDSANTEVVGFVSMGNGAVGQIVNEVVTIERGNRPYFKFIGPAPKQGQDAFVVDDDTLTVDGPSTTNQVKAGRVGPAWPGSSTLFALEILYPGT